MSSITAVLNSAEYLLYFCPFLLIKNMHLRKCLTFGVHIIGCPFVFLMESGALHKIAVHFPAYIIYNIS